MGCSSLQNPVVLLIVFLPVAVLGRLPADRTQSNGVAHIDEKRGQTEAWAQLVRVERGSSTGQVTGSSMIQVAGSSLPNCSHACGACTPCRLVMVGFICEEEAESCPMAYKCMCNSKSYPIP